METFIDTDVKKEGNLWYVFIMDKRIGDGSHDREAAEALQRWLVSGLQDLTDAVMNILDKAFAETGK